MQSATRWQRGALQRELTCAAQRGVERFLREYAQHDPELARALASDPRFWQHPQVRTAIRTAVLHPQQPSDVAVLVGSLADVLPEGTDPARVERAATALLATVAEEIWQVDGAGAVRVLYVLAQLQTTNAVLVEHLSRIEQRLAGGLPVWHRQITLSECNPTWLHKRL